MAVLEAHPGAGDRLCFTVFLGLVVHGLVVFGITFVPEDKKPAPHTMEITLSRFDDAKAPDKADFLARTNQQGSGTHREKARITTDRQARKQSPTPSREVSRKSRSQVALGGQQVARQFVAVQSESTKKALLPTQKTNRQAPRSRPSLLQRSLEIAALEASLDQQQRSYARRPRVTRVTAASTLKAIDAEYVSLFKTKVEKVGKLNFPEEAGRKLYGRPRILVAINADGSVKDIQVLESSGSRILDDATIRIIRLAAPFPPFPEEVRRKRDVLEIIRTFSYQNNSMQSY